MSFFIIAALVYFSMHALVWARISAQLQLSRRAALLGMFVAGLLTVTPFLAHFIPPTWPQPLVRTAWWLVYCWIGVIFYLFWLQLCTYACELVLRLFPAAWRTWFPRGKQQLQMVLVVTTLIVGYGLYAATQWHVPRLIITSPHVTRDTRIVLVSDTHFGVMTRQAWVERLAAFIRSFEPDLVLFAGDQVNDHPDWLGPKAAALAGLNPPLGVFGVLGNHEFYVGMNPSRSFHDQARIRLLRNETLILPGTGIQLIGIDDPAWGFKDHGMTAEVLETLTQELAPDHFQILITHRPWGWKEKAVPLGIGLQVAGHTHGGQIFPFRWFVRSHYKQVAGHFQEDESHLFVTTGAGTWGPPLRVGARPEVVVIDLVQAGDGQGPLSAQ